MTEMSSILKNNEKIKEQLNEIQNSLNLLNEKNNQENINIAIEEMKKDITYSLTTYIHKNIDNEITNITKQDCSLADPCKKSFKKMLKINIEKIQKKKITNEYKESINEQIHKLRINAPKKECSNCIDRIDKSITNHINLLESVKNQPKLNETDKLTKLNEEKLVKEILEPLSNKQRIEILDALSKENKSHSELSKITGLYGGNLIFHLDKLLKTGMIIQKHDRGEYTISNKGFKMITILNNINKILE